MEARCRTGGWVGDACEWANRAKLTKLTLRPPYFASSDGDCGVRREGKMAQGVGHGGSMAVVRGVGQGWGWVLRASGQ